MASNYDLLRADMAAKRNDLSPRLRQVADYALQHPHDMALETIAAIADRAGVPGSSLIRFANAFGYDGFTSMQRVFRSQLVERTTDYAERVRGLRRADVASGPASVLERLAESGIRALEHLRGVTSPEEIERAVRLLLAAGSVHVVGQQRAFAVSAYLAYAIGQLGQRTHLLDGVGGMTMHQASFIDARDLLIAVSFAPYAPETLEVLQRARAVGAAILVLTDGPLSPLLPLATAAFEIDDAELQGFRSLSATMCLALTLVIRLGQRLDEHKDARGRASGSRRHGSRPASLPAPKVDLVVQDADGATAGRSGVAKADGTSR
ncbi:MAG: MurR/RpiR family transcriptional regulator [Geminicoccaceae bacterium]